MSSNDDANGQRGSTPFNVPYAALYGAAVAFARPPPKPAQSRDYSGLSRDQFAETKAGAHHSAGTSSPNRGTVQGLVFQSKPQLADTLRGDVSSTSVRPASALLPTMAGVVGGAKGQRREAGTSMTHDKAVESSLDQSSKDRRTAGTAASSISTNLQAQDGQLTDLTSIPPTKSLIRLFTHNSVEQIGGSQAADATPSKVAMSKSNNKVRPAVAPKPERRLSIQSEAGKPGHRAADSRQRRAIRDEGMVISGQQRAHPRLELNGLDLAKPQIPPPRRSAKTTASSVRADDMASQNTASPHSNEGKPSVNKRLLPPPRQSAMLSSPALLRRHSASLGKPYQEQSIQTISPHITGDSLANAMVGAHLAMSRNGSPARSSQSSRRVSPQRPVSLRHTLRDKSPDDDEEEEKHEERKKKLKHLVHKAPNKHHEGTRKHWRDIVTERERKRYEGVWAANKGLLISGSPKMNKDAEEEVLNLVARDIWSRSHLSDDVLEEVWYLVDRHENGRLTKEEFVVGLWLIDQRLKGRKLPMKVSDSVWNSVTGLGTRGVKVRSGYGGKKLGKLEKTMGIP